MVALLLLLTCWLAWAAPEVLVVGDEEKPLAALGAFLGKHGHSFRYLDQAGYRARKPGPAPAAMMMYVHNTLDDDTEAALISYTRQGGRLIILHHGLASARMRNKEILPFAGMVLMPRDSTAHPWKVIWGDVEIVNLRPGHYVTSHNVRYDRTIAYTPSEGLSVEKRLPGFVLPDTEAYLNQLFSDARSKTVLLGFTCQCKEGTYTQDRAGWYLPVEKGHLFYFQQGHHARDFDNPSFRQIILNSLNWQPGQE